MVMKRDIRILPWSVIWPVALTTALIAAGGWALYWHQTARLKRDVQNDLAVIADLKSKEISDWRRERMGDAIVTSKRTQLARRIARWQADPADQEGERQVRWDLEALPVYDAYESVILADRDGAIRLIIGKEHLAVLGSPTKDKLKEVVRTGKVHFSDFYRCDTDNQIHLDIFAPLLDGKRVTAVIIFRIDPEHFLFPLIQSWPLPRKSAETLIVRKDGNDVLFLNELRHRAGTAMQHRIPLSDTTVPAVMAVVGKQGIVEGFDYRQVPVLAAIKRIPGSQWFMVAKVDQNEVYRPVRLSAMLITASCLLLIALVGVVIGLIWQRRQKDLYRLLHEAEQQRKAVVSHFEHVIRYANDIMVLADDNLTIIDVNDRALEAYGYERDGLCGRHINMLRPLSRRREMENILAKVRRAGNLVIETEHVKKDGSTFPVEVSARFIDIDGKQYLQSIIRDITERKRAQTEIASQNAALKTLHECALALAALPEGTSVSDALVEWLKKLTGGYAVTFGEYDRERREIVLRRILLESGALARLEAAIGKRLMDVRSPVSTDTFRLMMAEQVGTRGTLREITFGAVPKLASATIGVILGIVKYVAIVYQTEGTMYATSVIALKKGQPDPDPAALRAFAALGAVSLRRAAAEGKLQTAYEELRAGYREIEANNQQLTANNEELAAAEEELRRKNEELMASEEELKDAEEELKKQIEELQKKSKTIEERERDFRLLVENAPDAIYIQTKRRFAYANPRCLRLFGTDDPRQLIGTPVLDRVHPDNRGLVSGRITTLNEQRREVPSVQYAMLTLAGVPVPVEVSAVPFKYKREDGALVFVRDITERKRAEEELRLSEEKFAKSFQGNAALMAITSLENSRFIDVNERWIERMGYTHEEAIGHTSSELGIWTTSEDHAVFVATLRQKGSVGPVEYDFHTKDGAAWTGLVSSQVTSVGGQQVIVSSIIDISERKRAEQGLRKSEEENRAIINSVPDILFRIDAAGTILDYRAKTDSMLYVPPEAFVDKRIEDVLPPQVSIPAQEMIARTLKDGSLNQFEYALDLPGGQQYFECRIVPLAGQQVLAVVREITERKQAEEKIWQQLNELKRWHNAMIDREERIRELKAEVNGLLSAMGKTKRYDIAMENAADDAMEGRS